MKKISKIISAMLVFAMLFQAPCAFASVKTKSKYTGITYTHASRFDDKDLIYGMDISHHNGKINFKKVKKDGIKYVFVRVGYTGYTKSGFSLNYDKKYKTYIKDAKKAGLMVGVYWYSQAKTVKEAKKEANALLKAIKGYELTMPVVFDYEFADTRAGRLDSAKLSKTKMTANALAFLNTVSNAGYDACIYASENFFLEHLYPNDISQSYKIWLANYSKKTNYKGNYEFWQHTSKGRVKGMKGNVDINFWYKGEDTTFIGTRVYTGQPIQCDVAPVVVNGNELVKDVDYTLTYSNNVNIGKARITLKGIGKYKDLKQIYTFNIVPDRVSGVKYVSSTDNSLSLTWNEVLGAQSYVITAESLNNDATFKQTVYGASGTIDGLIAGNQYIITVCAQGVDSSNKEFLGEVSNYVSGKTTGTKISGIKASERKNTSLTLSWYLIDGCESYNIFKYDAQSNEYQFIGQTFNNQNTFKVIGLKDASEYKFKVRANKANVACEESDVFATVTTPKRVSNKSVKSRSRRKITYSFKKVNATGYEYQWSTYRNFKYNFKTKTTKSTRVTIKTAQSRKRYYVRVRAYKLDENKNKVYGSWSKVKSVKVR